MNTRYDVCVVGAGMVGTAFTTLLGLSNPDLSIALLDRATPKPFDLEQDVDLRVSALGRSSQRILQACEVWDDIRRSRYCPYYRMQVWDASQRSEQGVGFDCSDIGEADLGAIVENNLVQSLLLQRLRALNNVDLVIPARPDKLDLHGAVRQISLQDGRCIETPLVVGADGAGSKIRELAGIEVQGWSYAQQGVVAMVTTEQAHQNTAWQRFLPGGPLAFLPLSDGRCSIVWSCIDERANELLALDERAFNEALSKCSGAMLGRVTASSQRASFPLSAMYARDYVQQGLALIGDAAHVVHPLAGQGANLGFLDAASLVQTVVHARSAKRTYYDRKVLRQYERWRKGENLLMMSALDGIKRLFDADSFTRLRSAGLSLVGRAAPVRNRLIRHAMGLAGDLPETARSAMRPWAR